LAERDLQSAVETVSGAGSSTIELEHWPSVGPVDLMLDGAIALELKWCQSGDTLVNCAWGIANLAGATAEGQVEAGFLVAGAPVRHWESNSRGVELLSPHTYVGDELVRRYSDWWRHWCDDVKTRPTELPTSFAVTAVDRVRCDLAGEPYELRLAQVEVVDSVWRLHVCPHRQEGHRCRPRPGTPRAWAGPRPSESSEQFDEGVEVPVAVALCEDRVDGGPMRARGVLEFLAAGLGEYGIGDAAIVL
jgi:hypothetical protein